MWYVQKGRDILVKWKDEENRKPILLFGARQTGKSYIMEKFGKNRFDAVISVDFEKNPQIKAIFDGDLGPEIIIPQLEVLTGIRFIPGRTLIVFDEIQACPRAITALKYFYSSGLDLYVMGAGSLLGVAINRRDFSFPVGSVKTVRLCPLDFEEFLIALGEDGLIDMCRDSWHLHSALPNAIHERLLELFRTYLVVGGMPEVVSTYLERGSFFDAG